jgi:hypothetical protein
MRSVLLVLVLGATVLACGKKEEDADGDGVIDEYDCAPDNAEYAHPQDWDVDDDGDGFAGGIPVEACLPPAGTTDVLGDCADGDPNRYPGAPELCNEMDDDCDGDEDEEPTDGSRWYRDTDGDGYGGSSGSIVACDPLPGYIGSDGDCADNDPDINPDAYETCDGVDEDCNELVDDNPVGAPSWFIDADGDGWGDAAVEVEECSRPDGYVDRSGDCDDDDDLLNPGMTEYCNGFDDDCDGLTDGDDPDEAGDATWYLDSDADGYGVSDSTVASCTWPDGYARRDGDCADDDEDVNPDAEEICLNGIDDNCDDVALGCGVEGESALSAAGWASFTGPDADALMGLNALAAVGDWTADGVSELAFGAQGGGEGNTGGVYVVTGGASGASSAAAGVTLSGSGTTDYAGYSIAAVGDTNGDGVGDLLVGAPGVSDLAGVAYLVHGPVSADGALSAVAAASMTGSAASQAGIVVGGIGDQDGDGAPDLIVGANGYDAFAGKVYVMSGATSGGASLDDDAVGTITGGAEQVMGWGASSGDTTGDGTADLAVGAGQDASSTGQAYVFEGPVDGDWAPADGTAVRAEQPGSAVAVPVDLRGDYNGDGYADLVVAANFWDDSAVADSGRVYVVFGPVDTALDLWDADVFFDGEGGARCGYSASWVGSPNGDTVDDLAIGCALGWDDPATAQGSAVLVYGGFEAGTYTLSATGQRWTGSVDIDVVGGGVGPAGDQDGDGIDDLLVAAAQNAEAAGNAGKVYVVLGESGF